MFQGQDSGGLNQRGSPINREKGSDTRNILAVIWGGEERNRV